MSDITGDVRPSKIAASAAPAHAVRTLNDAFRKHGVGGMAAVTPGIKALGTDALIQIVRKIREFDDFTADNDPYGEHDMGAFLYQGERIFWKIDYYDLELKYGSPEPADPTVTERVLTVMLAAEY